MDELVATAFARQWTVLLLTATVLLVLAEAGFRFGLRLLAATDAARKGLIGGIQGAALGLLGLLLGFTFSMAVGRYEVRRDLVVKDANAIGTTWLRVSLLPAAHQAPVREALRRYTDLHLKFQVTADDPSALTEDLRQSAALQAELWQHANDAAGEAPTPITSLFIAALNDTIDTEGERLAAGRANIPDPVWLLVLLVAGFGCFVSSYGAGSEGARTALINVALPLLITVVIVLIFDLAHSRQGLIRISQQPLLDLQQSIRAGAP